MFKALSQSQKFQPGSRLWLIFFEPERFLFKTINWRTGFLLQSLRKDQEGFLQPVLLDTKKTFPNQALLCLPLKKESWLSDIYKSWKDLDTPSLRVFIPLNYDEKELCSYKLFQKSLCDLSYYKEISPMSGQKNLNIQLLSDGTGETGLAVLKAVLVQYEHEEYVRIFRHRNIRSREQMESLFKKFSQKVEDENFVVYTLVLPESRKIIKDLCQKYKIQGVDILEDLINVFDQSLKSKKKQAGILRVVDEDYFKRIEAMDFFLKHDDGRLTKDLETADIILVGVSRTSKTPLSLFLSNKGWKVANIPLVYNIPPPEPLFKVDQKKIVALTIHPDYLLKIRKNRLERFGYDPVGGHYASKKQVYEEVSAIQALFYKQKWPVLDVTDIALEETAGEIVRIVSKRMKIPVKII